MDFFAPVTYGSQNKTRLERALELVDEYFYLGGKFRVTIFDPDETHPQLYATKNRQNRYRSWTNITIKVASYCTVILPLIALSIKGALRSYLQISSIKVQRRFVFSSRMESELPTDILINVFSFLNGTDLSNFAQSATFTGNGARNILDYYTSWMEKAKGLEQPYGQEAKELLFKLITVPSHRYSSYYWNRVLDCLMQRLMPDFSVPIEEFIEAHAKIADLLASSGSISSNRMYNFLRQLGRRRFFTGPLLGIIPWVGVRSLEQYLLKPQLDSKSVTKALKEYLTQQAKGYIHVSGYSESCFFGFQIFKWERIVINPTDWFGHGRKDWALWEQSENQKSAPGVFSKLVSDVLSDRIISLQKSFEDRLFMVEIKSCQRVTFSLNFTLFLAKRLTDKKIFFDHKNTIDINQIEKQYYARSIPSLSFKDQQELIEHHPNAIWYVNQNYSPSRPPIRRKNLFQLLCSIFNRK